jgi:MraZ protein
MELLTGEFKATLDEKGRISLPAHLRRVLNESSICITQGMDDCLWLHPASEYTEMMNEIRKNTDRFSRKDRDIRRRIFNSHDVEIDKAGRIPIPQNFRELAGLSKDCMILGQIDYIEIWDEERYRKYLEDSEDEFVAASEELGAVLKRKRGASD